MRDEKEILRMANTLASVEHTGQHTGIHIQLEVLRWALGDESEDNRFSKFAAILLNDGTAEILDETSGLLGRAAKITLRKPPIAVEELLKDAPKHPRTRHAHR